MLKDSQGLAVTTNSPEVIAAIDRFFVQSLSYGNDALVILKGIEADPTCVMANALAAAYYLSLESGLSSGQALPYLQAAKKYLQANEREQLYVKAIDAWATGDTESAIAHHEKIAEKFPRDLISVQMGQYHYFYQGKKEGLLQIAERVLPANPENPYLQGMIAFGLEQCHRLEKEDIQKVLSLYDTYIWGRAWQESSKDQVGAISLLLRLELRGVEVGNRWQEIAAYHQFLK